LLDGKEGEGSFKLETVWKKGGYVFGEVVSGGRIAAVELMSDLLPLRRSGSFRLAISLGN
jgi:hypothetical protein